MAIIQEVVEMDGIKCLLTDTEENINAAKSDLNGLRQYILRSLINDKSEKSNANKQEKLLGITISALTSDDALEIESTHSMEEIVENDPLQYAQDACNEFVWDRDSEKYFVKLLLEEVDKYRSQKVKKKVFWELIRTRFKTEYGVRDISGESLAKKLANLKRRYTTVKTNMRASGSVSLKPWHLFASMDEFFSNDETFNSKFSFASMEVTEIPNDYSGDNQKEECPRSDYSSPYPRKQQHNDFYYKQKKMAQEMEKEKLRLIQLSMDRAEARAKRKEERAKAKLDFLKKHHEDHMRIRERELRVEEERNALLRELLSKDNSDY